MVIITLWTMMNYKVDKVNWRGKAKEIKDIKELREKVFICEHRIPEHDEFDNHDSRSEHVLVRNEDNRPIATGRICEDGKISRIAVLMKYRHTNAAEQVIKQLVAIARAKGLANVSIDAELDRVSEFKKQGFKPTGAVYMEGGNPKQTMTCSVSHFECPAGVLH